MIVNVGESDLKKPIVHAWSESPERSNLNLPPIARLSIYIDQVDVKVLVDEEVECESFESLLVWNYPFLSRPHYEFANVLAFPSNLIVSFLLQNRLFFFAKIWKLFKKITKKSFHRKGNIKSKVNVVPAVRIGNP